MLKAEDNSNLLEDFSSGGDISDCFSIDIDQLFAILGENSDQPLDLSESSPEDSSCKNVFQNGSISVAVNCEQASNPQNGTQELEGNSPIGADVPEFSGPSHSRAEMGSDCLFESPGNSAFVFDYGKLETPMQISSPVRSCSLSLTDWLPGDRIGVSVDHFVYSSIDSNEIQNQISNCSTMFNFSEGDGNNISDCMDHVNLAQMKTEFENEFGHVEGDLHSNCYSHLMMMDKSDSTFSNYSSICGSSMEELGALERNLCTSPMELSFMDADISLPSALHNELNSSQVSGKTSEASDHCSPIPFCTLSGTSANDAAIADPSRQFLPDSFNLPFGEKMIHIKDDLLQTRNICHSEMNLGVNEGTTGVSVPKVHMMDYFDINSSQGMSFKCEASPYNSPITGKSSSDAKDGTFPENASKQSLSIIQSFMSSKKEEVNVKDEKEDELLESMSMCYHSVEIIDEATIDEAAKECPSSLSRNYASSIDVGPFVDHAFVPGIQSLPSSKNQTVCIREEREDKKLSSGSMSCHSLKVTGEAVQNNPSGHWSHVDDDADICILEDISAPLHPPPSIAYGKSLVTSQRSTYSDPVHHPGNGSMRVKANDERLTFQVALQDLSQPKSEASPPEGDLAVPLLRHQRIALSWMVQKETASLHCSGGILADDQGLGKTISTIALILKERSSSSTMSSAAVKQGVSEALNLDEDDDGVPELDGMKQDGDPGRVTVDRSVKRENAFMLVKGRPAAGTLVVCPTSVLRQWAEELHNKVTSKANLSVLVYHGTNRTKDPYELAKYDVVLTTYSIVSMEVPKQPLVDKEDDEKGKEEAHGLPPMGLSSSKKRKYSASSEKNKKRVDGALLESVSRPLARVGWFRVVLDEAQSIKNHRTQVARACWGLRAKRRWCLSGTPIQNAVDDLYSYFRFLRFEPYATYKLFCSTIKIPVTKNPPLGYKKLQAVLKTVMLRRTKGTLLDGKPIIILPPKSIELKKVDFSKEERDFYSRLEADSRAQFKVYAAAGTVKQNYVNILLMLLRLRQACDHPLLVKGYDSNSVWRSSIEMAKKLPRDKQMGLLNCLEASLAICGICNDPPEDAVVAICGHVFCNQCICEHLTGDDNLCPTAHCKVQLSVTSVFSRVTLKKSISDQLGQDCSPDKSGSELEPFSEGLSSDSSKIKAALEVLESLSKQRDCTSKSSDEVARYPQNSPDTHSGGSFKDMPNGRNVDTEKGLNDSNTKVMEKAIVFSQWTRMLDLLEARLKSSSIQYRRLDGTMSVVARDKAVKDFNSIPEITVMIMSLKAASLGLNMVAACHVLLLDLWWNPTTEDQAIDRAHRIGQTRPVTVLRLTVKDTVEDRILALQQKKREMVASAFGEDETGSRQTRLTVEDLRYLFMA